MKYVARVCVFVAIGTFLVAGIIVNSDVVLDDPTKVEAMSWTEFRTQWEKHSPPGEPVSEAKVDHIFGKPDSFHSGSHGTSSYSYHYISSNGAVAVTVTRLYEQYPDNPDYRGKIESVGSPFLLGF